MIQNEAYALGLYFYLLTLSEEKAIQKASIVYKKIQKLKKKNKYTHEKFVQLCLKYSQISLNDVEVFEGSHYFKHKLDISKWQTFLLKAKVEEVTPVLFFMVLKVDLSIIANCFGVSENTILTRCHRAIIKINNLLKEKKFNIAPYVELVPANFALKKQGERQMSRFISENLIFESLMNLLDKESQKTLEVNLTQDADLKQKYSELSVITQFITKLNQIDISEVVTKQIQQKSNILDLIEEQLQIEDWPDSVRWVSEALGVALIITLVAVFVPWGAVFDKFYNKKELQVTLVEILKSKSTDNVSKLENAKEDKPLYQDEAKVNTAVQDTKASATQDTKTSVAPAASPVVSASATTATPSAAVKTAPSPTVAVVATKPTPSPTPAVERVGYLFRGKLIATNVPVITPKIREKIMEYGGRKAGEVELGWQKSQNTSYFHFTIPDTKLDELDVFLQTYGQIKILKERHERIMPDGIIRLIIEIEEAAADKQ